MNAVHNLSHTSLAPDALFHPVIRSWANISKTHSFREVGSLLFRRCSICFRQDASLEQVSVCKFASPGRSKMTLLEDKQLVELEVSTKLPGVSPFLTKRATVLSGGHVYELPLKPENNFVGDLDSIPEDVLLRAKIMVLSYPHNPTGACVNKAYLKRAVDICKKYNTT